MCDAYTLSHNVDSKWWLLETATDVRPTALQTKSETPMEELVSFVSKKSYQMLECNSLEEGRGVYRVSGQYT